MSEQEEKATTRRGRMKSHKMSVLLITLLVIAVGIGGFWYWRYTKALANNPSEEQRRWTAELSEIVVMPSSKPVITVVVDSSKLTNDTLKKQAQNGDRLYIFGDTKQLILYRPAEKKIVNMLTIQSQ